MPTAVQHSRTTDQLYELFRGKDPSADGLVYIAVKTTGVFCRSTCPARTPNRENVEFFVNPAEAVSAGYRACKRCRPLEPHARPPAWVSDLRRALHDDPARRITGLDLRDAGIDPAGARRYFARHYGLSFAAYSRAVRAGAALGELRSGATPEVAAMRCGYESVSGFRDAFRRVLGRGPHEHEQVRVLDLDWIDTPLGPMIALASDGAVCMLEFVSRPEVEREIRELRNLLGAGVVPGGSSVLARLRVELGEYFEGVRSEFSTPLETPGTAFQQRTWAALREIPCGETISYAQLAGRIGSDGAQRAVGRANGQNRIAVVIPCHRVIRTGGALGGYAGGLWRKQRLLDHEAEHWGHRGGSVPPSLFARA